MRIYTSYFGKLGVLGRQGILPISIARWSPKWYEGAELKNLAPTPYMIKGDITQEQYVKMYKNTLSRLRVEDVVRDIDQIAMGRDVALLCWEKPGDFCHRHLLADWIVRESGVLVEEFGTEESNQTLVTEAQSGPDAEQELTLF